MSETGIIDMFVLLGPKPKDVSRQYAALTGTTELPPEFSVAYHQCRWNYNDQADVQMVSDKFDEHDIPMDIMWLDIEHTDGKKYFTWDSRKFPDSIGMINNLTAVGRKLVTIVDPHIKKDQSYWVHKDCTDLSLYVKDKDGKDYEGWCWPGASYYPDFLNPEVRDYFAKQYKFENYVGTNLVSMKYVLNLHHSVMASNAGTLHLSHLVSDARDVSPSKPDVSLLRNN
jgi:alpha 1,3-glucosidase